MYMLLILFFCSSAPLYTIKQKVGYPCDTAEQDVVSETYKDQDKWNRMSIMTCAGSGDFSSDRTIRQYADEIWGVSPLKVKL